MNALTRVQLDNMPCGAEHNGKPCTHPAGGPLFMHGKCHPGGGNEVEYVDGVLHIRCNICKAEIVDIVVAGHRPPPARPRRR